MQAIGTLETLGGIGPRRKAYIEDFNVICDLCKEPIRCNDEAPKNYIQRVRTKQRVFSYHFNMITCQGILEDRIRKLRASIDSRDPAKRGILK